MSKSVWHRFSCAITLTLLISFASARKEIISRYSLEQSATNPPISTKRTITLPLGNITGIACQYYPGVIKYFGIPYADPPVGNLRFKPPVLYFKRYPSPSLDATGIPPPCGTFCDIDPTVEEDEIRVIPSENCLYVNVWAPIDATHESKLPVRAYIHGGAINMCSASDDFVDGCADVFKTRMIHVNIQFRRGAFGLLAHPHLYEESGTVGNWGFMDQQMALRWIQENIGHFGGDPDHVLLNGQSGGGRDVELHIISPFSKDLFSSAISQSPPCVRLLTKKNAYNVSKIFMASLGCAPLKTEVEEIECMRGLSWNAIVNQTSVVVSEYGPLMLLCEGVDWFSFFNYVLDGTVFPNSVDDALSSGLFNQVPYLVGSNSNEGSYFRFGIANLLGNQGEYVESVLELMYPGMEFESILSLYGGYMDTNDTAKLMRQLDVFWTDAFYTCPIHKRMVARASHSLAPTYMYAWNVTPTCPPENQFLGATHCSETRASMGITHHIVTHQNPTGFCNYTTREVEISDGLLHAWAAMASTGVPMLPRGATWPLWDAESELVFDISMYNSSVSVKKPGERCLEIEKLFLEANRRHGRHMSWNNTAILNAIS